MNADEQKWLEQGKLLANSGMEAMHELHPFAVSMLAHFHGADSPQVEAYLARADAISKQKEGSSVQLRHHARGAVLSTMREVENGLVSSLRMSAQGELLGDFIGLAKEALEEGTEQSKNVAAVLAAAAFEDTVRRLGAEKAGVEGRPKLDSVLQVLKDKGVIKGGNVSLAASMPKFRNDSLHADWEHVSRAQVESCLSITEWLLRENFS